MFYNIVITSNDNDVYEKVSKDEMATFKFMIKMIVTLKRRKRSSWYLKNTTLRKTKLDQKKL